MLRSIRPVVWVLTKISKSCTQDLRATLAVPPPTVAGSGELLLVENHTIAVGCGNLSIVCM